MTLLVERDVLTADAQYRAGHVPRPRHLRRLYGRTGIWSRSAAVSGSGGSRKACAEVGRRVQNWPREERGYRASAAMRCRSGLDRFVDLEKAFN
ncbi:MULTISPECIES: hypothetical protein [Paracoccus]|uniref:hypothetical protein n=1 Tax=Paracoccus TaxID=265 RepID=UPI001FB5AF8A|nr:MULTISPECIES: hypothetical protein [Paracoccus]MCJ1903147.1 hypothetical protein [Paracoccus versutus]MDF3905695.1 hypothetical protein [Paracoccus sp. AS002]